MRRIIAVVVGGVLGLLAAYGVITVFGLVAFGSGGSFDSARWKAAARHENVLRHPRAAMLVSLEPLLRIGMSRDEVEGLLGKPDSRVGNRLYHYGVGATGFGVDYDMFVIEFDEAGRLVRHFIVQG